MAAAARCSADDADARPLPLPEGPGEDNDGDRETVAEARGRRQGQGQGQGQGAEETARRLSLEERRRMRPQQSQRRRSINKRRSAAYRRKKLQKQLEEEAEEGGSGSRPSTGTGGTSTRQFRVVTDQELMQSSKRRSKIAVSGVGVGTLSRRRDLKAADLTGGTLGAGGGTLGGGGGGGGGRGGDGGMLLTEEDELDYIDHFIASKFGETGTIFDQRGNAVESKLDEDDEDNETTVTAQRVRGAAAGGRAAGDDSSPAKSKKRRSLGDYMMDPGLDSQEGGLFDAFIGTIKRLAAPDDETYLQQLRQEQEAKRKATATANANANGDAKAQEEEEPAERRSDEGVRSPDSGDTAMPMGQRHIRRTSSEVWGKQKHAAAGAGADGDKRALERANELSRAQAVAEEYAKHKADEHLSFTKQPWQQQQDDAEGSPSPHSPSKGVRFHERSRHAGGGGKQQEEDAAEAAAAVTFDSKALGDPEAVADGTIGRRNPMRVAVGADTGGGESGKFRVRGTLALGAAKGVARRREEREETDSSHVVDNDTSGHGLASSSSSSGSGLGGVGSGGGGGAHPDESGGHRDLSSDGGSGRTRTRTRSGAGDNSNNALGGDGGGSCARGAGRRVMSTDEEADTAMSVRRDTGHLMGGRGGSGGGAAAADSDVRQQPVVLPHQDSDSELGREARRLEEQVQMQTQMPQLQTQISSDAMSLWSASGEAVPYPERLARAAMHIKDAIAERPIKVHRTGLRPIKVYLFLASAGYVRFLQFVSLALMLLVLFEPPRFTSKTYRNSFGDQMKTKDFVDQLFAVEFLCVVTFILDLMLQMYSLGLRDFLGVQRSQSSKRFEWVRTENRALRHAQRWEMIKVFCVSIFALDLMVFTLFNASFVRFSRPLRPLYFIVISSEQRRWGYLIARTIPKILGLALLIGSFIGVYAIIGVLLFSAEINVERVDSGAQKNNTSVYQDEFRNFNTFGKACVSLYTLMTSESYPYLMYPAYDNMGKGFSIYFISFLLVVMFFLANLAVPYLYRAFRTYHRREALQGRILERTALLAAFQLLDVEGEGWIDEERFEEILVLVRPDLYDDDGMEKMPGAAEWMYHQLVWENGEAITPYDFFSTLDVIMQDIEPVDEAEAAAEKAKEEAGSWQRRKWFVQPECLKRFRRRIRPFFTSRLFDWFILLITMATSFMLAALPSIAEENQADAISLATGVIYCFSFEMLMRLFALGPTRFWRRPANQFDTVVVGLALACTLIEDFGHNFVENTPRFDAMGLVFVTLRVVRVIPAVRMFKRVNVILRIVPFLLVALTLLFHFTYAWAVIGMELFSEEVTPKAYKSKELPDADFGYDPTQDGLSYCRNAQSDVEGEAIICDTHIRFDTFLDTMFALFQVLTTSNWHDVMYQVAVYAGDLGFPALYFISFHFVAVVLLLQLMLAIFVDAFEAYQDKQERDQQRQQDLENALDAVKVDKVRQFRGIAKNVVQRLHLETREQPQPEDEDLLSDQMPGEYVDHSRAASQNGGSWSQSVLMFQGGNVELMNMKDPVTGRPQSYGAALARGTSSMSPSPAGTSPHESTSPGSVHAFTGQQQSGRQKPKRRNSAYDRLNSNGSANSGRTSPMPGPDQSPYARGQAFLGRMSEPMAPEGHNPLVPVGAPIPENETVTQMLERQSDVGVSFRSSLPVQRTNTFSGLGPAAPASQSQGQSQRRRPPSAGAAGTGAAGDGGGLVTRPSGRRSSAVAPAHNGAVSRQ